MPPRKNTPKKEINPLTLGAAAASKAFKGEYGAVTLDPNSHRKSREHLSTGSVVLDYIIGGRPNKHGILPCPGLPRGAITEIWGHEGAGKTTVALTASAKTCKDGARNGGPGTVVYIDWEHAVDVSYAKTIGVPVDDPNRFMLVQPTTLEQGFGVIWTMAKSGVDLIVIDSIGAGIPEAFLKQKDSEKGELGRVGLQAAKWSKILPELMREISVSRTTILAISQLRKKINTGFGAGRGPSDTPQGGEVWKFYSWVRLGFRRVQYEKGKIYDPLTHSAIETAVKSVINAKLEKCKVSPSQGREATIHIAFGEGIDDLRSVLDIAVAHKIIVREGAWYSFQPASGTVIKMQGMDKLRDALKEVPGLLDELHQRVIGKITALPDGMSLISGDEIDDESDLSDLSDLDEIIGDKPEVVVEGAEEAEEEENG